MCAAFVSSLGFSATADEDEGGYHPGIRTAINNGLAPPNPDNIIDGDHMFTWVLNSGCQPSVGYYYCTIESGTPTRAELSTYAEYVWVSGTSSLVVDDGYAQELMLQDNAAVRFDDGSSNKIRMVGSNGGTKHVQFNEGSLNFLELDSDSGSPASFRMNGGYIYQVEIDSEHDGITFEMTGGEVDGHIILWDVGTVRISGGSFTSQAGTAYENFESFDADAIFEFVGSNFAIDGVPVSYGDRVPSYASHVLTGTLASGEPINVSFWVEDFIRLSASANIPTDSDGDGVPDGSDNCVNDMNPGQEDYNSNGQGDACDSTYPLQCEPTPLYEYWNGNSVNDHFYATVYSPGGIFGWAYQRSIGSICQNEAPGTVALHRYWNTYYQDHTYLTLYVPGGAYGWQYEMITGYIYPADVPSLNTFPIYSYWNPGFGDHFLHEVYTSETFYGYSGGGLVGYLLP